MPVCVLIARQRSGTGALGSVLDQHSEIKYLGEVFHDDAVNSPPNYFWHLKSRVAGEGIDIALPGNAEDRLVRYFAWLEDNYPQRWIIPDVKYRSTHHFNGYWTGLNERPFMLHLLQQADTPVIHLERKNCLRTLVSGQLAELNRVWHTNDASSLKTTTIELDIPRVLPMLRAATEECTLMSRYLKPFGNVVTLEYEDIFDAQGVLSTQAADAIGEMLGIDEFESRSPAFKKQTGTDLREVISNYSEVEELLRDTEFAGMLE